MNNTLPIAIRAMRLADHPYIYDTWMNQYAYSQEGRCCWLEDKKPYRKLFQPIIRRIIEHSIGLIACNPDDTDQIFGYIIFDDRDIPLIHYLWVKAAFRHMGIAHELLDQVESVDKTYVITFLPNDGEPQIAGYHFIYKPELRKIL